MTTSRKLVHVLLAGGQAAKAGAGDADAVEEAVDAAVAHGDAVHRHVGRRTHLDAHAGGAGALTARRGSRGRRRTR